MHGNHRLVDPALHQVLVEEARGYQRSRNDKGECADTDDDRLGEHEPRRESRRSGGQPAPMPYPTPRTVRMNRGSVASSPSFVRK